MGIWGGVFPAVNAWFARRSYFHNRFDASNRQKTYYVMFLVLGLTVSNTKEKHNA